MDDKRAILSSADSIATLLKNAGVESVVIGAIALAAFRYIRFTEDVDLAIACDLQQFRQLVSLLEGQGFECELSEPDAFDPLSGVIDIRGSFGLVQVINFGETIPAVIRGAIAEATLGVSNCETLRFAPIEYLVALKLYAGGLKSKADIIELLQRNPETDLESVRDVCRRYRLRGIDPILDEI